MGRRSNSNKNYVHQRKILSWVISEEAFKDRIRAEAVNRLTEADCYNLLMDKFGEGKFYMGLCKTYELGEVLSDSVGRGTLQQLGAT